MGLFSDVTDTLTGVTGDLTGGIFGTSAGEEASGRIDAMSEETKQRTLAEIGSSWKDIKKYLTPYMRAGGQALNAYRKKIGAAPNAPVFEGFSFDPSKLEDNPAYQFVKEQGLQAINRSAAKNRSLTSGNRMMALTDFASGLASQEYGNEFQRQLQTYQTREQAKGMNFDARNLLHRQKMGDLGSIVTMGLNTAGNMGTFRQNISQMRSATRANRQAESAAAQLIPVQERQNFVQGLLSAGGSALGGS